MDDAGANAYVSYPKVFALKTYFQILVDTVIFVDKSVIYVDIVYIKYFMDMEMIHQYNEGWGTLFALPILQIG